MRAFAFALTLLWAAGPASAQPADRRSPLDDPDRPPPPAPAPPPGDPAPPGPPAAPAAEPAADVGDAVAAALLQRGRLLFERGDHADAKLMFIESLERSPKGPSSAEALDMLRAANRKLGIKDLDHGSPFGKPLAGGDAVDPYGGGPADPYGGGPSDPYGPGGGSGAGPGPAVGPGPIDVPSPAIARRRLIGFGAVYGALLGMALAGPEDSQGNIGGGAILGAVGGSLAGSLGTWWLMRRRELTPGQAQAILSGGTWGAYTIGLLGDAFSGVGTSTTNDIFVSMAVGGAIGTGGGLLWSRGKPSEADVSLANSMAAYGTVAGLELGAVMQPPESEAYSINAAIGAGGGLLAGLWAGNRLEVSRRRMLRIDLGVLGGAAVTWALLYPALADDTTDDDEQAAGLISLAAMAGGGYLAWRWTRGMDRGAAPVAPRDDELPVDDTDDTTDDDTDFDTTTGLLRRARSGRWTLAAPLPRPMQNRALGPVSGPSWGVDLLSGRF